MTNINNIFKGCQSLSSKNIFFPKKNNDICIIGLWYGDNYGSMLTYYALHQVIKKMNYSILMIDNPLGADNFVNDEMHPTLMTKSLYNISQRKSLNNLPEFNKECKLFLVGSDQLWNIYLSKDVKQFYFLGFTDNRVKKLSYGTSFGIEYKGTEAEKKITKKNLERFDGISVRDELSLNITKEVFGLKNVVQVCDPALLCDFSDYINLINKSNISFLEDYILAYILDPCISIGNGLEQLSIDKNIKVIIILDHPAELWKKNKENLFLTGKGNIEVKHSLNLSDWLWYFNNSRAVLTDSFHGTIFSIIFKKPFITIRNNKRGGGRFTSLLRPLKLMNRLFESPDCINKRYDLFDKIDYTVPFPKLSRIKQESFIWLKEKLKNLLLK